MSVQRSNVITNSTNLAVEWVLQSEGGYVDNPNDRGGPTNHGVTLAALTAYRGKPCTAADVEAFSLDDARSFYNQTYVIPLNLAIFDRRIATCLLDNCVVMGIGPGIKLAQRCCGQVTDGNLGPITAGAIGRMPATQFVAAYIVAVQKTYIAIAVGRPNQIGFLAGWLARSQRYLQLLT